MSEAAFTRNVASFAQGIGLLAHWCRDSRKCYGHRGFPDLVIIGKSGIIFAECKMPDGETSASQDLWAWTISQVQERWAVSGHPVSWMLWQPADLEDGTIERELRQLR